MEIRQTATCISQIVDVLAAVREEPRHTSW